MTGATTGPWEAVAALGVALVAAVASVLGAYWASHAKRSAEQANDAVNHRHLKDPENGQHPPKLYDSVLDMRSEVKDNAKRIGQIAGHVEDILAERVDTTRTLNEVHDGIQDIKAWKNRWTALPDGLDTAEGLLARFDDNDRTHARIIETIGVIGQAVGVGPMWTADGRYIGPERRTSTAPYDGPERRRP